nr:anti sigma factor C-terminal domain-containing protein [Streptococcus gallolyticus]
MTGQAVEVAITFDKPYTYQKITEMVPDSLLVNWYWIGTSSTVDTANLALDAQLGFAPSSINDYADDFKNFKSNLKKAIESGAVDFRYSDIVLKMKQCH